MPLAESKNDPELLMGAYRALAVTLYFTGDFEASGQNARCGVEIWRSKREEFKITEVISPAVACLCYMALSEWHAGAFDSCKRTMAEATVLAKDLNDLQSLVLALINAGVLGYYEGNHTEVERCASKIVELSTRHNFATWLPAGTILRGWAQSGGGQTADGISSLEAGIQKLRNDGAMLDLPFWLLLKAQALQLAGRNSEALETLEEAEALAEIRGERHSFAELHRLRGVFLAALGADETQIEASLCAAIRIAKEQKSVSLKKRAKATYEEYRKQKASASGGRAFRLPL